MCFFSYLASTECNRIICNPLTQPFFNFIFVYVCVWTFVLFFFSFFFFWWFLPLHCLIYFFLPISRLSFVKKQLKDPQFVVVYCSVSVLESSTTVFIIVVVLSFPPPPLRAAKTQHCALFTFSTSTCLLTRRQYKHSFALQNACPIWRHLIQLKRRTA